MALSFFKIGILIYGAPDILGQIIHCWWGLPHVLDNWLFSWYDGSTSPVGATKTTSGIPKFPWGPKLSLVDLKEFYPPTWGWPDNSSIFFQCFHEFSFGQTRFDSFCYHNHCVCIHYFPFYIPAPFTVSPIFFFSKFSYILSYNLSVAIFFLTCFCVVNKLRALVVFSSPNGYSV